LQSFELPAATVGALLAGTTKTILSPGPASDYPSPDRPAIRMPRKPEPADCTTPRTSPG